MVIELRLDVREACIFESIYAPSDLRSVVNLSANGARRVYVPSSFFV